MRSIHYKQLAKFLLVGGISTLINYSVFAALYILFAVNYIVASVVGYISGLLVGFKFNSFWTFETAHIEYRIFIRYVFVYLVSLLCSTLFLRLLVESFDVPVLLANIGAIALSTILNFTGCKIFVFKIHKSL